MQENQVREIARTTQFNHDLKKSIHSGRNDFKDLLTTIEMLASGVPLPEKFLDHSLSGECRDYRECHIRFDRLLIYRLEPGRLVLVRFGSHSELYKK